MALFFFALSAHALAGTNVDKAKKLMKAGKYPSAFSVLEEELKENPDNAEALYLSGICYLEQDNPDKADQFFYDAVRIKSDYRFDIANAYKKLADNYLIQGGLRAGLYKKAIQYVPFMRKDIAIHLFNVGTGTGRNKDDLFAPVNTDDLFALAIELDDDMRRQVATYYFNISRESDDEYALNAFKQAARYHTMYQLQYENRIIKFGERFLRKAKKLARIPGKEKDTENLKKLSGEILGKQVVLVALPEYRLYDPGEYIFTLKAGEQTDHWIKFTYENSATCSLSSSDDNFYLVFDNGDEIQAGSGISFPINEEIRFKIIALRYQKKITMTVKMKHQ